MSETWDRTKVNNELDSLEKKLGNSGGIMNIYRNNVNYIDLLRRISKNGYDRLQKDLLTTAANRRYMIYNS